MTLRAAGLVAFACALAVSACSNADNFDARVRVDGIDTPTPTPEKLRDAAVADIFAAAGAKNVQKLVDLRAQSVRAGGTPDPTTALALYTIDQAKYERLFVDEYPEDFDGIADDFGRRFGASGLDKSGSAFPVDRLGDIAAAGNFDAQYKLIEGLAFSAGSPEERDYLGQVERIAQTEPAATLAALSSVPMPARLSAISETDWCAHPPNALFAAQPTQAPNAAAVASEFRSDLVTECRELAQASATPQPRRRPHRGAKRHASASKKGPTPHHSPR